MTEYKSMNQHEITAIVAITGNWPDRFEILTNRTNKTIAIWDDGSIIPKGELFVVCELKDGTFLKAPLLRGHNNYEFCNIQVKKMLKKKVEEHNDSITDESE